jgi:hypothetical protein
MRQRLRAMRAGWGLLLVNAVLALLDVPYAALGLIGTAILAFLLTIRFIAARYGDGSAGSDATHSTWVSDAFGWTALSAAHDAHHHNSGDDYDRKPQADSSDSSGGFFSFFSDSGSSDSSSGGSDYSSSDGGSSDNGSSDSGSSSSSSD